MKILRYMFVVTILCTLCGCSTSRPARSESTKPAGQITERYVIEIVGKPERKRGERPFSELLHKQQIILLEKSCRGYINTRARELVEHRPAKGTVISLTPAGDDFILTVTSDAESLQTVRRVLSRGWHEKRKRSAKLTTVMLGLRPDAVPDISKATGIDLDPVTGPYFLAETEAKKLIAAATTHPQGRVVSRHARWGNVGSEFTVVDATEVEWREDFRPSKTNADPEVLSVGTIFSDLPETMYEDGTLAVYTTPEWANLVGTTEVNDIESPAFEFITTSAQVLLQPDSWLLLRASAERTVGAKAESADEETRLILLSGHGDDRSDFFIRDAGLGLVNVDAVIEACGEDAVMTDLSYWGTVDLDADSLSLAGSMAGLTGVSTNDMEIDKAANILITRSTPKKLVDHNVAGSWGDGHPPPIEQTAVGTAVFAVDAKQAKEIAGKHGFDASSAGTVFLVTKDKARALIGSLSSIGAPLAQSGFVTKMNVEASANVTRCLMYPTKYEEAGPQKRRFGYEMAWCEAGFRGSAMPDSTTCACCSFRSDEVDLDGLTAGVSTMLGWRPSKGMAYPVMHHLRLGGSNLRLAPDAVVVMHGKYATLKETCGLKKRNGVFMPSPNRGHHFFVLASVQDQAVRSPHRKRKGKAKKAVREPLQRMLFHCKNRVPMALGLKVPKPKETKADGKTLDLADTSHYLSDAEEKAIRQFLQEKGVTFPEGARAGGAGYVHELHVVNTPENIDKIRNVLRSAGALMHQRTFTAAFLELTPDQAAKLNGHPKTKDGKARAVTKAFAATLVSEIETASPSKVIGSVPLIGEGTVSQNWDFRCSVEEAEAVAPPSTTNTADSLGFRCSTGPERRSLQQPGVEFGIWFTVDDNMYNDDGATMQAELCLPVARPGATQLSSVTWKSAETLIPPEDGATVIIPLTPDKKKKAGEQLMFAVVTMRMIPSYAE